MRLKSCRLDLTGICFTKLGDNIQKNPESVPSRDGNVGFVELV